MERNKIYFGDCREILAEFPASSIDAVVTDPPYGFSFMGKKWDYSVPDVQTWAAILRVLKPGGHLISFARARTYHRIAVNIEDAGFEIRDQIQWIYGTGFPKNRDISKEIDKAAGAERKVIGKSDRGVENTEGNIHKEEGFASAREKNFEITEPATDDAKKWNGWGTALKPANEPIALCRKPIAEKNIAANVLKNGTGAINIEASKIGDEVRINGISDLSQVSGNKWGSHKKTPTIGHSEAVGRWPSNVILDEYSAYEIDRQSGFLRSGENKGDREKTGNINFVGSTDVPCDPSSGGASRFFFIAKASPAERNGINHVTVKPIKLMRYLIQMITPPGGVVLDPFIGSGTTAIAARELGVDYIGVEKDEENHAEAVERIKSQTQEVLKL